MLFRAVCSGVSKNYMLIFGKCSEQYHTDHSAGKDFSGTYRKHHKWDWKIDSVSIMQNKWYDDGIGNNRRDWRKPFAASQTIGKNSTDQSGNASEKDINWNCSAKKVGNDTSHK